MLSRRTLGRTVCSVQRHFSVRWSSTVTRFSLYGDGSQGELIEKAKQISLAQQHEQEAMVILASRSYAKWLTNQRFMSQFLDSLAGPDGKPGRELNVLSVALDGLLPVGRLAPARHGFSIAQGSLDELVPDLWVPTENSPLPKGAKPTGAVSFATNFTMERADWGDNLARVTCTLPLANTVFQNNRPFTLFASKWRRSQANSKLEMIDNVSKQTQTIDCRSFSHGKMTFEVPLGPVTPARKIVAGLGNIVRQVDVDGMAQPASAELEKAVQSIYDKWIDLDGNRPRDPIRVWAVVMPPDVDSGTLEVLDKWRASMMEAPGIVKQMRSVEEYHQMLQPLLNEGSRIYQVVSGGGGWGKKQGLLSLDPDTKFTTPGDEDLDSFIRSFKGEMDGFDAGVVAPGSFIQFFIAPAVGIDRPFDEHTNDFGKTSFWGVSRRISEKAQPNLNGESWEIVDDTFGAMSAEAMFLQNTADGERTGETQTKITVDESFVGGRPKQQGSLLSWLPIPIFLPFDLF